MKLLFFIIVFTFVNPVYSESYNNLNAISYDCSFSTPKYELCLDVLLIKNKINKYIKTIPVPIPNKSNEKIIIEEWNESCKNIIKSYVYKEIINERKYSNYLTKYFYPVVIKIYIDKKENISSNARLDDDFKKELIVLSDLIIYKKFHREILPKKLFPLGVYLSLDNIPHIDSLGNLYVNKDFKNKNKKTREVIYTHECMHHISRIKELNILVKKMVSSDSFDISIIKKNNLISETEKTVEYSIDAASIFYLKPNMIKAYIKYLSFNKISTNRIAAVKTLSKMKERGLTFENYIYYMLLVNKISPDLDMSEIISKSDRNIDFFMKARSGFLNDELKKYVAKSPAYSINSWSEELNYYKLYIERYKYE